VKRITCRDSLVQLSRRDSDDADMFRWSMMTESVEDVSALRVQCTCHCHLSIINVQLVSVTW